MPVETKNAVYRAPFSMMGVIGNIESDRSPVTLVSVATIGAGASVGSVYTMYKLPSFARLISGRYDYDDITTGAGVPTIDLGFAPIDTTFATVDGALKIDINVSTAAAGATILTDPAKFGLRLWELAGLAKDPGGHFAIIATVKDAAVDGGGEFTMTITYAIE